MYQLQHPNVIQLFNHFEDNESLYLVMELVSNGDLFTRINGTTMKEKEAKKLFEAESRDKASFSTYTRMLGMVGSNCRIFMIMLAIVLANITTFAYTSLLAIWLGNNQQRETWHFWLACGIIIFLMMFFHIAKFNIIRLHSKINVLISSNSQSSVHILFN